MWEYVALLAVTLTVVAYVVNSLYDWGRLPISGTRGNALRMWRKRSTIGRRHGRDEHRSAPSTDWPPSGTVLNPQAKVSKTDRREEKRDSQES